MPGKHINQRHVEIFMGSREEGKSVRQASAAAGISERTGRRVDSGEWVPRSARPERWWRTRADPLAGVWEREVEPLLREDPELRAYSLWEHALDQGWISDDRQKRTFERRVRAWKAEHGPDREVIFRQDELPPGELCCSDFFSGNRLEVTIRGARFPHILHHFCAAWSGWQSALVVPGSGESFAALHAGLEKALRGLGGSCRRHRTDSLSAAFRNVLREARKDVASRYQALPRSPGPGIAVAGQPGLRQHRGVRVVCGPGDGTPQPAGCGAACGGAAASFGAAAGLPGCGNGGGSAGAADRDAAPGEEILHGSLAADRAPGTGADDRLWLRGLSRHEAGVRAAVGGTGTAVPGEPAARAVFAAGEAGCVPPLGGAGRPVPADGLPPGVGGAFRAAPGAGSRPDHGGDFEPGGGAQLHRRAGAEPGGAAGRRRVAGPRGAGRRVPSAERVAPRHLRRGAQRGWPRRTAGSGAMRGRKLATDLSLLPGLLQALRLPAFAAHWQAIGERAIEEGWHPAQYLGRLAEQELLDREQRRLKRYLAESKLPPGKTLENFDFRQLPGLSRARIRSFAESTEWLGRAENLLAFGNSGSGKTHLLSGIGRALVGSGRRVLFTPASSMLEQLKRAQTDLDLERLFLRLDKFDLLILDDFSYVRRSQNQTAVLFELVSRRYERRSLAVAANQPFSEWTGIFPAAAMFSRWSQENWFKYMRTEFDLDTMPEHALAAVDDDTQVVNPVRRVLDKALGRLRGKATVLRNRLFKAGKQPTTNALLAQLAEVECEIGELAGKRRSIPKHVAAGSLDETQRLDALPEPMRLFCDTLRMIAYRAETAMMPCIAKAQGKKSNPRAALRALFSTEATILPDYPRKTLTVRILHLANKAHSLHLRPLLETLNATKTVFPGTDLAMLYELASDIDSENPFELVDPALPAK